MRHRDDQNKNILELLLEKKWCRRTDNCWKKWWAAAGLSLPGSGWHGGSPAEGLDLKTIFFMVTELSVFFVWDSSETHLVMERGSLFWRAPGQSRIPFKTFENGLLRLMEDRTNSQTVGHQIRIHLKLFMKAGLTFLETHRHLLRTSLNFAETERAFRKAKYRMANGGDQNQKVADEALKGDDCDCQPEFLSPPSQPPKHKGKQKSQNNESEKPSSNSQPTLPVDLKNILEKQLSKSSRFC